MRDPRTDPDAVLRHWRVEVNFEAWDAADAERMIGRMIRPLQEEERLLFATNAAETVELRDDRHELGS